MAPRSISSPRWTRVVCTMHTCWTCSAQVGARQHAIFRGLAVGKLARCPRVRSRSLRTVAAAISIAHSSISSLRDGQIQFQSLLLIALRHKSIGKCWGRWVGVAVRFETHRRRSSTKRRPREAWISLSSLILNFRLRFHEARSETNPSSTSGWSGLYQTFPAGPSTCSYAIIYSTELCQCL